jgi:hypothetical protein
MPSDDLSRVTGGPVKLKSSLVCGFVFLWTLSLWPAAHFIADNFSDVADYDFDGTAGIFLVSAFIPSIASAIASLLWLSKRQRGALLILFGAACLNPLLFCFGAALPLMVKVWAAAGVRHGMAASYAMLCLSAFLALGLGLRTARLQQGAAFIAIGLFGFNAAQIVYAGAVEYSAASVQPGAAADLQARPSLLHENIYYVLLDSYPGPITTRRVFDYDNPLPDMLAQRGFFSSGDFKTNYFATFLTMSSVLDANYDVTETSSFPLDKAEAYPIRLLDGYVPAAIKALQTAGFKTYFRGNWYARCADSVFVCLGDPKIKQSVSFGTFIDATPAARFFPQTTSEQGITGPPFDQLYNAITPLKTHIPQLVSEGRPFFVFAHHMAPHPPANYNPDCSEGQGRQTVNLNWSEVQRETYLSALKCVNLQVLALLDDIDKYDSHALVVIMSDHGSFTQSNGSIEWDRMSPSLVDEMTYPINFIRAPPECESWLYKGMAQVNTMRFILGCAMRQKPDYLADDTYLGRGRTVLDGPFVLYDRQQFHEKE